MRSWQDQDLPMAERIEEPARRRRDREDADLEDADLEEFNRRGRAPTPTGKKPSLFLQVVGVAGGILGAILGRVVGLPVLIVAAFGFLVGTPLYFLTSGRRRNMAPAGGVQAGHALWMLLGATLIAAGAFRDVVAQVPIWIFVEGVLFLAGAITVVLLPYLPVIIVMTVYQVAAFGVNIYSLTQHPDPEIAKAIFLHMSLRAFAVALMFEAFFRKVEEQRPPRRRPRDDDDAPPFADEGPDDRRWPDERFPPDERRVHDR
ncbi:MAG: hypothetical protein U0793_21080 [Gemmataceae bacterium]